MTQDLTQQTDPTMLSNAFFFKDVFDRGYSIARKEEPTPPQSSMGIIRAYNMLDDAYDEKGAPKYDYFVWAAIARLQITAGDVACAAAVATPSQCIQEESGDHYQHWYFSYQLPEEEITFLTLTKVIEPLDEFVPQHVGPMRVMGPVEREAYVYKLGAYPKLVHPRLPERAIANLHFMLIQYLTQTGLQVEQHWIPEDSSKHFARYKLTDGIVTYILDYNAPELLRALIAIDAAGNRTEEDGALVPEPEVTEFTALEVEGDLPSEETGEEVSPEP